MVDSVGVSASAIVPVATGITGVQTTQVPTLSTNAVWAWMKGANTNWQPGIYGTQGVPAIDNTPGARQRTISWTHSSGALWLFGGYGYGSTDGGYLNDLWKYDPGTESWTWMKGSKNCDENGIYGTQGVPATDNTPGARQRPVSWIDSSGALWFFGGYGYASIDGGYLNDLWKYDPAAGNWTWMKGSKYYDTYGVYGMQGVPAPDNTPGAREYAVSWIDGSGTLWLFGGLGYGSTDIELYLNDLWKYDPATGNWTWMKGSTNCNQKGTYGTQGVPATGNSPGARFSAVSWMDNFGALWLFGGQGFGNTDDLGSLNDLWKYDPATSNWTWMKGSTDCNQKGAYGTQGVPATGNSPGARKFAVSWKDNADTLWLFGGQGYDTAGIYGSLNDLWKYDPATGNWTWMKGAKIIGQMGIYGTQGVPDVGNLPGPRYDAVSWTDNFGVLWLFGGYGLDSTGNWGWLNDLWKYDAFAGGVSLTTNALVFNATYQCTNPVSQMIGMTNVGGKEFSYTNVITYSAGASGWLTVLSSTGTIALNGATVMTNQVNISSLGAGTYYATNQVTAVAVTNSPQIVVVTLTVNMAAISSGVCADYDGDGKADPALYDESTGTWKVKLSSANYYLVTTTLNGLGGPGSASVSADYDGDRLADPAVYHEQTGRWIVLPSSLGYAVAIVLGQTLGGAGYSGMPADYDGDRLADPGVYQRTQGDWKVLLSSANYYEIEKPGLLGGTGYRAVAADYDGDMKGDPAVYGESNGVWAFKLSSAGYVTFAMTQTLGGTGYIPVPADYDGDGFADPAVRSTTGNEWIVMFSSGGYTPVPLTILFE